MEVETTSPWRVTDACVDVSVTPQHYGSGGAAARRAITKIAMKSFLMRYNKGLNGVPMALQGPLRFPKNYVLHIGSSPFSHVTAHAKVLLFAPRRGSVLTAKVIHVAPDHIGLTVLGKFHAYIEKNEFFPGYEEMHDGDGLTWRFKGTKPEGKNLPDFGIGAWVRFCVLRVEPARVGGLFHIAGTVVSENAEMLELGFCEALPELEPEGKTKKREEPVVEPENQIDDSLFAEDTAQFNDDLSVFIDGGDEAPLDPAQHKINMSLRELERKRKGKKPKSLKKKRRKMEEEAAALGDFNMQDMEHPREPNDMPLEAKDPNQQKTNGVGKTGNSTTSREGKKRKKESRKEKTIN